MPVRATTVAAAPLLAVLILAGAVLALGGCGFRPAGSLSSEGLENTRVVDTVGRSDVAYTLSRTLDLQGRPEPERGVRGDRTIRILEETFERRQLSVTSGARTAEYELVGTVRFEVLGPDGAVLIEPRAVSSEAVFLRDRGNLLGTSSEERRLREQLREQLARRILSSVSVAVAGG